MELEDRLRKILDHSGLSIRRFNEKLGLSHGHFNKFLSGEFAPKLDTLEKLRQEFPEIRGEWLYLGDGEMLKSVPYPVADENIFSLSESSESLYAKNPIQDAPVNAPLNAPVKRTDNSSSSISGASIQPNVYFVDARAAAGLPASIQAGESIEEMPSGYLPFLGSSGSFVAIQVTGDSMFPTISDRDWLIASRVYEVASLRQGLVYLVITPDGVVAKRFGGLSSGKSGLILRSDNHEYQPYTIKGTEALQIWEVSHILSSDLSLDPAHRLDLVDRHILDLKDRVKKLEKSLLKQR